MVSIEDSWMALVPVAIAVVLVGIPYREGPRRVAPLAPWRSLVLGLGLALSASAIVAAIVGG
ncbi:hypothetical protein [Micromonospora sp. DT31]|uniref:hypothetical protein n=1 Tax=Micromonospora sp. DT31 TaxID=3393434 RepID=UPI003CEB1CAB